jgi:dynein heavy chain
MLKNFLDVPDDRIPWDAMRFMIGEINYGGRATDEWDKRTLNSILSIFMKEEVLDDTYKFSHSGTYYVPKNTDYNGYRKYVTNLPDSDDPEIFGLHENANITF